MPAPPALAPQMSDTEMLNNIERWLRRRIAPIDIDRDVDPVDAEQRAYLRVYRRIQWMRNGDGQLVDY